jgi:hypothetical protein
MPNTTGNIVADYREEVIVCPVCLGVKRIYLPTIKAYMEFIRERYPLGCRQWAMIHRKEWHKSKSVTCSECEGIGTVTVIS